jgi:glutamate-1-semialdehyde 2,1-aminomutase
MRVAPGGAQQLYGVSPDLTVISKALGGGFPVAAFGGSAEIMALVADGRVFHGGVYSGNALVLSAANAVLSLVLAEGDRIYAELNERAEQFAAGVKQILRRREVPHVVQDVGPMISVVLTHDHVDELRNYREVRRHADFDGYIRLQHALLDCGVYVHPNQFEPMYLSTAHCERDIEDVLERFDATVGQTRG